MQIYILKKRLINVTTWSGYGKVQDKLCMFYFSKPNLDNIK